VTSDEARGDSEQSRKDSRSWVSLATHCLQIIVTLPYLLRFDVPLSPPSAPLFPRTGERQRLRHDILQSLVGATTEQSLLMSVGFLLRELSAATCQSSQEFSSFSASQCLLWPPTSLSGKRKRYSVGCPYHSLLATTITTHHSSLTNPAPCIAADRACNKCRAGRAVPGEFPSREPDLCALPGSCLRFESLRVCGQ
jgi:hypothetical protein